MRRILVVLVAVTAIVGCNRRVFTLVEESCDSTIPVDLDIPSQAAADILIVVDNSGSMREEQIELAKNFLNTKIAADPFAPNIAAEECPLGDLNAIPVEYQNPPESLYKEGGPLSQCGFIQLLAAFDNDFRVGVITTDVGQCDNRFGQAPAGWGAHPQRGCLQPDGPTREGANLIIARADLADPAKSDFAARFQRTLDNINTFGIGFERGLDAMDIFLDESSSRAPECSNDLATFRRPEAQLVVIFLTDEEDCSHADGANGFPDENINATCGGNSLTFPRDDASRCYGTEKALLAPVSRYADALRRADPRAKIAVIGGMVPDTGSDDDFVADGCIAAAGVPVSSCWESNGNSIANRAGDMCSTTPSAEIAALRQGQDCCLADPGSRYLDLARSFGTDGQKSYLLDSICNPSYRATMIKVAEFISATIHIDLVEAPIGGLIIVSIQREGETEPTPLAHVTDCETESGWILEGDRRVTFCNDAIPGAGDKVSVRAKGRSDSVGCLAVE